jgi:ribosomal protein L13
MRVEHPDVAAAGVSLDTLANTMAGMATIYADTSRPIPYTARGSGDVYIIKCGDFVKIGESRDVRRRLARLQKSNPLELHLLRMYRPLANTIPARVFEVAIHRLLSKYRHRGEWFRMAAFEELKLHETTHLPHRKQWPKC